MEPAADDGAMKDAEVRQRLLSDNENSADKYVGALSLTFKEGLLWAMLSNTITF